MKATIEILGNEIEVEFSYEITAYGRPASGPSYSSGGEPAEPHEYEVTVDSIGIHSVQRLEPDAPGLEIYHGLDCPTWLREFIEEYLQQSDTVYEQIEEEVRSGDDVPWPEGED